MEIDPVVVLRVKGVKASCERARLAFFLMLVCCCTITVTLYNTQFAWVGHNLKPHRGLTEWPPQKPESTDPRDKQVATLNEKAEEEMIKNEQDNTNITVGLLGFRIDSSDLTLFGPLTMFVISMYFCLCARRANFDIGTLLDDVQNAEPEIQRYVLAGVKQSIVFNTPREDDISVFQVGGKWLTRRVLGLLGLTYSMLTYSPAFNILATVELDVHYLLRQGSVWWDHLQPAYKAQFVILDVFASIAFIIVLMVNVVTNRFQTGTARAVRSAS